MLTDSHCHLTKEYYSDINEEIEISIQNGVDRFINIGCEPYSLEEVIELSKKHPNLFCAIGIHPNVVDESTEKDYEFIENSVENNKVIAIGEIGLDYHYENYDSLKQKEWFEKQLQLAQRKKIPVIIHSRDATKDTVDILRKYKVKGVIHSFSGSYETAKEYMKMGYVLGINGVVTFRNSRLKEVIKLLPLEYIVLETDAPYLTPEPFRGQKNSPKHIKEIAAFISELKGISVEDLAKITNENLRRIFDI